MIKLLMGALTYRENKQLLSNHNSLLKPSQKDNPFKRAEVYSEKMRTFRKKGVLLMSKAMGHSLIKGTNISQSRVLKPAKQQRNNPLGSLKGNNP